MTTVPWRSTTQNARQWTVRYALAAVVAAELIGVLIGVVLLVVGVEAGPGLSFLVIEGSFLLTLVPLRRRGRLTRRDLGLVPVPGIRSTGLVFLGLIAYGWFGRAWQVYVHAPPAPNNFPGVGQASTIAIVMAGVTACVGAPVVEEIFFRGLLYRSLRNRLGVAPACLIASAIFGLLHWQYPLVIRPELVFFGVIACLLYERTGSLFPGIAMHAFVDASGFEYALTGRVAIVASVFLFLAVALICRGAARGLVRRVRSRRRRPSAHGEPAGGITWYPSWPPPTNQASAPVLAPATGTRLPLLLACLAVATIGLIADRGGVFAAGATEVTGGGRPGVGVRAGAGITIGTCSDGVGTTLAHVGPSEWSFLRQELFEITGSVGGSPYTAGVAGPFDMWTDGSPTEVAGAPPGGLPAGFEVRRWAYNGDDVVADVLEFRTRQQAVIFFDEAVSPSCRQGARTAPVARIPQARHVVWRNPSGYTQQDTFLVRGRLVYRFTDVRRNMGASPAAEARAAFAITDQLACYVSGAACRRGQVLARAA